MPPRALADDCADSQRQDFRRLSFNNQHDRVGQASGQPSRKAESAYTVAFNRDQRGAEGWSRDGEKLRQDPEHHAIARGDEVPDAYANPVVVATIVAS